MTRMVITADAVPGAPGEPDDVPYFVIAIV